MFRCSSMARQISQQYGPLSARRVISSVSNHCKLRRGRSIPNVRATTRCLPFHARRRGLSRPRSNGALGKTSSCLLLETQLPGPMTTEKSIQASGWPGKFGTLPLLGIFGLSLVRIFSNFPVARNLWALIGRRPRGRWATSS